MNKRSYGGWLLLGLFLIAGGVALALRPANSSTANLEKVVPNFSLRDTDGRQVALADFNGKKAVVVVFVGTECPINNVYMPRLAELQQAYAERGVQFRGHLPDHVPRAGLRHPADHGHTALDNPRLLVRDRVERVPKLGGVVEADVGNHRHQRANHFIPYAQRC